MADKIDPRKAWAPYRPSAEAPWDLKRAGHLYRRAAFGATFAQLEAAVKDGPDKTINALLKGGDGQALVHIRHDQAGTGGINQALRLGRRADRCRE